MRKLSGVVVVGVVWSAFAGAGVELPRVSPGAGVSMKVGTTTIEVQYHRPGVKGRTIWGELVPYGAVWRLGANEATTISFEHPVQILGVRPTRVLWIVLYVFHKSLGVSDSLHALLNRLLGRRA